VPRRRSRSRSRHSSISHDRHRERSRHLRVSRGSPPPGPQHLQGRLVLLLVSQVGGERGGGVALLQPLLRAMTATARDLSRAQRRGKRRWNKSCIN
jgi:hypothetical protein